MSETFELRELDFSVRVFLNREEDDEGRLAIFSRVRRGPTAPATSWRRS